MKTRATGVVAVAVLAALCAGPSSARRGGATGSPWVEPEGPGPLWLGGPWETKDPVLREDVEIGIFVDVATTREVRIENGAVGETISVDGTRELTVRFFQRSAGSEEQVRATPGHDPANSAVKSWFNGHELQMAFRSDPGYTFAHGEFTLDTTFDEQQHGWVGTYAREGVTRPVRLERPGAPANTAPSPFVGTWMLPARTEFFADERLSCEMVNIAQGGDGSFLAWMNQTFLNVNTQGTPTLAQHAGGRWGVTVAGDTVTLDRDAYSPGFVAGAVAPRGKFVGRLTADGSQIVVNFVPDVPAPGAQHEPAEIWRRTTQGCVPLLRMFDHPCPEKP